MRVLIAAGILIVLVLAGWFVFGRGSEEPQSEPAIEAPAEPAEAQPAATAQPRFDIVRVSRGGFAVMAGTGEPGATVEVVANGDIVASETVGQDGAWAVQVDTPLDAGPVELALRQTDASGEAGPLTSEDTVVVYVAEGEGAPVVLRTTPGGATEVLQREDAPVEALGPLAIETIDYDASNSVIFAGRAEPGSMVQLLLGGRPLGAPTTADEAGRWEVTAEVPPGRYALRAVQYDGAGEVAYAVEVPFERARDEDIVRTNGGVVVQPGNSLWLISREVYGEGRQYTVIFAANANQIRDPDLIYPGQVFSVPDEE